MSDSGQKFIRRNRKPRVHITYEDPYNSEKLVELPFVMGVLADLSGNASKVEKPEVAQRKFLDIDMDNFEKRMAAIKPGLAFRVANKLGDETEKLGVNLEFSSMDDFKPTAIARQVPAVAKLLEAREQLKNLQRYMDGKVGAENRLKELLGDPELMAALRDRRAETPEEPGDKQ
ncbi:type VI secretion system contractile sheath small subunit [Phreatobacter stygius]|uniref:Type VI secretion system contractile sheath small subunit n=2 Tax=Phreatobacter stygius TaxID=1940610 RepID=A0A4D7B7Y3_9HYPH|nr:type VI secretion system contractile sheath small subunit [Phreatobacter stygius]